jgi:hypothetical protein
MVELGILFVLFSLSKFYLYLFNMKQLLCILFGLQTVQVLSAQTTSDFKPGLSLGTHVVFSPKSTNNYMGAGIGVQARIHVLPQLNTEWFLSYLTGATALTSKNSYYIFVGRYCCVQNQIMILVNAFNLFFLLGIVLTKLLFLKKQIRLIGLVG